MKNVGEYKIDTFPISRIATIDIGIAGLKKHHIRALIELDVTEARKNIFEKRKLSQKISFNSWLIKCIGCAVEECKEIHGIRKGKRKVVIFDDIDIAIVIEREVQGKKVPLPYVIRKVNEKSISDIRNETRDAQNQSIEDNGDYILGEKKNDFLMKVYYSMPGLLRGLIWKNIIRNPFLIKENMGTVMVTSVGMVGRIRGWVIPVSVHPLCFAIGSIVKKPGVIDDKIEIREYIYITVLVDHDVIDGAPAVRALSKLTKLVESGFGLE
ncbi:catalytic domain of components of various dehydrogenase complexes [Alkaliphilus metalliredigens QYMF]|uniref:Catalytic domain of components of various dehydrogenase complexes n=1 Tax=Alkaliphilus metalliredigens (strain QYMF) TaxID=293826 RepID=A6TN70_ALKMQ|nr:2-oxo acid dehydrogenase subunit E2 [Alkaliphilus metalliredigens]ABR47638.1 catalytic domain of components of various dehydrogenase complexes [Alkaliphilus metalliredigens QYMF]